MCWCKSVWVEKTMGDRVVIPVNDSRAIGVSRGGRLVQRTGETQTVMMMEGGRRNGTAVESSRRQTLKCTGLTDLHVTGSWGARALETWLNRVRVNNSGAPDPVLGHLSTEHTNYKRHFQRVRSRVNGYDTHMRNQIREREHLTTSDP